MGYGYGYGMNRYGFGYRYGQVGKRASRPALTPTQALVADWLTRVAANGGIVGSGEQSAVTAFASDLYAATLVPRLVWVNPRVGDYAASKVPLIGATNEAHTGFTASDYSPATGLTADGSSKYLDTGLNLQSAGLGINGMSVFARLATNVLSNGYLFSSPSGFITLYGNRNLGAANGQFGGNFPTDGTYSAALPNPPGVVVCSRVSPTDRRVYTGGLQSGGTTTTVTSATTPNETLHMGHDAGNPTAALWSGRITVAGIGLALDSSDSANLTTAIDTLETALGR